MKDNKTLQNKRKHLKHTETLKKDDQKPEKTDETISGVEVLVLLCC